MLYVIVASVQKTMDPLSEVFSLLDIQSAATSRLETAGAWAVRFPPKPSLKFHAVLRGGCWITLPGESPCRLEAGDTFLLANSPAFVLASDPQQEVEEASQVFAQLQSNVYRLGGDENILLGGGFVFESGNAQLLLDALPPFMLIPVKEPEAVILRSTLNMLDKELENTQMGSSLMTRRLADILLVQVLRAYVNLQGATKAGWIGALSDRRIGAALNSIHADVAHHWKVSELASIATMSRSGFAVRFKELVGLSPLDYVLRWRMRLAYDALRKNESSIASLAGRLGYASESAFSNAFKRVFGQAPTRYRPGR
ncbi:AraC family transcriptional regulator [Caballeronia sordidicola]|uniref:AraC family transcriptional regulator n=1 Tax=Caballeronia sordidicola TaxID=196367 RepID=UPI000B088B77|nr:AraC family transcriptional regulator [Caballeronia sordidicola]